jgi:hypothetical protein
VTVAVPGNWKPVFSPWRHGGWYVDNIRYPSGAVGCVSRNFSDHKWRIIAENTYPGDPHDHTYPNRESAAWSEALRADRIRRDGGQDRTRPSHPRGRGERIHILSRLDRRSGRRRYRRR